MLRIINDGLSRIRSIIKIIQKSKYYLLNILKEVVVEKRTVTRSTVGSSSI
jgi:hypothetical protein